MESKNQIDLIELPAEEKRAPVRIGYISTRRNGASVQPPSVIEAELLLIYVC